MTRSVARRLTKSNSPRIVFRMADTITRSELKRRALAFIKQHKTHVEAAEALGVSKQLIGEILAGGRNALGPKVVAGLGYEEEIRYRKKTA